MKRSVLAALCLLALLSLAALAMPRAFADDASDKSWFVGYVENQISTPDRKITLGQIDGALSSDVRISSITIADRKGVWLTIKGAHLVWSQLALLQKRLEISSLEAQSITITRKPEPPEGIQPASSGFSLPELPVSVNLGKLSVPAVEISADVAGQDTTLSVEGAAKLDGGKLHAELAIERIQPAGGDLSFKADFDNATQRLALDLTLTEPKNGFLSTMLNLPGQPPLAFNVTGTGPLNNFAANIGLSVDGSRLLAGQATIKQGSTGLAFAADVQGNLIPLVDPAYADFVQGVSSLSIAAHQTADGGMAIERANLKSGVANLAVTGMIAADGFPTALTVNGHVGADGVQPVKLPGEGATLSDAELAVRFGDGAWTGSFELARLISGSIKVEKASIKASGQAQNLGNGGQRSLTFSVAGRGDGLSSDDAGLQKALGTSLNLDTSGHWAAGQPVAIDTVRLQSAGVQASFAGKLDGNNLVGDYDLAAPDLSLFDRMAGRPLAGKADVKAKGTIALVGGALGLSLDGATDGLRLGDSPLDPLLKGHTTLGGGVQRDEDGLHLAKLALDNAQFQGLVDGLYGVKTLALTADLRLANIGDLTDRAVGAAALHATMNGAVGAPAVTADLSADDLTLQGKHLRGGRAGFTGTLAGSAVDGRMMLSAMLDALPVSASATLTTLPDGTHQLNALNASAGAAKIAGDLALRPDALASGHIAADIPDMAAIAPLLLVKASGALSADVTLAADQAQQNATVKANAKALRIESANVGSASIDLTMLDLRAVPILDGVVQAQGVTFGSFALNNASATLTRSANSATAFSIKGSLPQGSVAAAGTLAKTSGGFDARLDTLSMNRGAISAALAGPVTIASRGSSLSISKAVLRLGQGGSISISGTAGETLALAIEASNLPLSLADIASQQLGAAGTLSASVAISGAANAPVADFRAKGDNLSVGAMRGMGLPPLQLIASGRYANKNVSIDAGVTGAGGLSVKTKGDIPLAGAGLSVAVQGSAPLALADILLQDRGAKATGELTIDARATGSLKSPAFAGTANLSNGAFTDPESGTRLSALTGRARFDATHATIDQLSAVTPGGGSLALTGSVGLAGGYPADLALVLRDARLQEADLATATVSGNLSMRGPLLTNPVLSGRIDVSQAEITIPEQFPSNAALLGVKHLAPPIEVARTLKRAQVVTGKPKAKAAPPVNLTIDLTIDAPSRFFVRGRGLDAELGGELRLTGPVANLAPVGAFKLRRGQLNVIGKNITLDDGQVTLLGDFDPMIDLGATTRTSSLVVTARIKGEASNPQIVLSSTPELPQDEVLAQFLFGRSIESLSPLEIAQLATAVAQLAGGRSGPDLLASIRKSTGLDTLGVVTDSKGNAAVQAGRYIGDKIYLGVTTGTDGQANAAVNLDITKDLKLRSQTGSDGSQTGVYYEREY